VAKLQLTLACGDYDLTRGLIEATTPPQGIDLVVLTMPSPERHWRMTKGQEFDVCEFSMASYLASREAGLPFTAIPAFPHRRFRHSFMVVNAKASISQPSDLRCKRVGLRTWQTTAGVWQRGMLQSEYALPVDQVRWVAQSEEDIPLQLPPGISLERLPADANLDAMLADGELEAAFYPELLPSLARGDSRVLRLFPDSKAEEQAYFQRTGIFPIMHTVVIRDEILRAHPWVAQNLLQAFDKAKEQAYRRLENPRTVSLAWMRDLLEEQRAVMGADPWVYGFAPNRATLETFCEYGAQQGLTGRRWRAEELFVPDTLTDIPKYVE
jgi:4,5-dihydroxyphthalate decarboxylase